MEPDSISERAAMALEEKDPTKIAGQIRGPRSRTSASANPVGGHNGVAAGLIDGSNSADSARLK
jgi:hypothetical protein